MAGTIVNENIDNWYSALISNLLSRSLKQKLTLSRAGSTVLLRYLFQSRLYLSVGVKTEFVDEVVQPVAGEVVLTLLKTASIGLKAGE